MTTRGRSRRRTRTILMRFSRVFSTAPSGRSSAWRQQARGFSGFAGTLFGAAAGSSFALGEVQNGGAQAARGHAQQGSAAGLFHVVAVGGDGEYIGNWEISDGICVHWRFLRMNGTTFGLHGIPPFSQRTRKGWGTEFCFGCRSDSP